ncbi:hypothetical protein [Nocardia carnea]|uniref:hypothetical protein n=1 Tax=Nocardia carnea TaxID=37328 RepID=UPI0024573F70|nr:hypothetical protein [Nocardia carnea]
MTITCSACAWPAPTLLSGHGSVRYWRCLCGQWLVSEADTVTATPGSSDFAVARGRGGRNPRASARQ